MPNHTCSITLAAGASTRMPADMRPKACCRVGPVSVINHALATYEEAGVNRHLVVVGPDAEKIMAEIAAGGRMALYAFQAQAKGTGDAVRCALETLELASPPEHVLICAGDKVIAPEVIRGLVETCQMEEADFGMVVGRGTAEDDSGRVLVRDDRPVAVLEAPDVRVRQLAAALRALPEGERPRTVAQLREFVKRFVPSEKQWRKLPRTLVGMLKGESRTGFQPVPEGQENAANGGAGFQPALDRQDASPTEPHAGGDPCATSGAGVSPAGDRQDACPTVDWQSLEDILSGIPDGFDLPSGCVSADEAAASPLRNLSVYYGRFDRIHDAMRKLRSDNVQGEWYLTDLVHIMAGEGAKTALFEVREAEDVMAFNTAEELETIRRAHAGRPLGQLRLPQLRQWEEHFALHERGGLLHQAAQGLADRIGPNRPALFVRSPGRINLMGRHIDHQGGQCNLMAIDLEIALAASPREDDCVRLWNAGGEYAERTFSLSELTRDFVWDDWLRTLDSQFVQRIVNNTAGDWGNYVIGAALRLQHRYPDRRLRGMDAFVTGNIPPGAGLSSSSALVVAAAEALVEINHLNVAITEFVDLCGEGEWFVGTRGGSADHAAIKFGRENQVVGVSFFPFRVLDHYPFPENCKLVVCYCGSPAKKTEEARKLFNARVACYHMAREAVRERFPEFAGRIQHLRDVNAENLGITLPALYDMLRQLPAEASWSEVERMAEAYPTVAKCVGGLGEGEADFPLRDVALFGLAEIERARRAGPLLRRGDDASLGQTMNVSHDGDRVAKWNRGASVPLAQATRSTGVPPVGANRGASVPLAHQRGAGIPPANQGQSQPFVLRADDAALDRLVRDASSLKPLESTGAALWQQPGAYGCSIPDIDFIADCALTHPGVLGAQLAGAGLGGCIMVLAREEAAESLREKLAKEYYAPRGLDTSVFICQPSTGCHALTALPAD